MSPWWRKVARGVGYVIVNWCMVDGSIDVWWMVNKWLVNWITARRYMNHRRPMVAQPWWFMVHGERSVTMKQIPKKSWSTNSQCFHNSCPRITLLLVGPLPFFNILDGSNIARQCQMAQKHLIGYSSVMTSDCPIMISFNHIFGISNVKLLICISRSLAAPHLLKNKRFGERAEKIRNSAAMDTCSQGTMRLSGPLRFPIKGTGKPT